MLNVSFEFRPNFINGLRSYNWVSFTQITSWFLDSGETLFLVFDILLYALISACRFSLLSSIYSLWTELVPSRVHNYGTRTASRCRSHSCRTNLKQFTILYQGPKVWNCLPISIISSSSFLTLVKKKNHELAKPHIRRTTFSIY